MPTLLDPEHVLPTKKGGLSPSQIVLLLLYPVVFGVGFAAGVVIGLRQERTTETTNTTNSVQTLNARIVPSTNMTNTTDTTNTANNTNVGNVNQTTNSSVIGQGEYLQLDAATVATLNQEEQRERERSIDQSASVTDILRQQDLISLKYNLKAYSSLKKAYPTTAGKQIRVERTADNSFYQTMKIFYGSTYNLRIDPESPTYYYGYSSDGISFELTAWLPSKNKAFIVKDSS